MVKRDSVIIEEIFDSESNTVQISRGRRNNDYGQGVSSLSGFIGIESLSGTGSEEPLLKRVSWAVETRGRGARILRESFPKELCADHKSPI